MTLRPFSLSPGGPQKCPKVFWRQGTLWTLTQNTGKKNRVFLLLTFPSKLLPFRNVFHENLAVFNSLLFFLFFYSNTNLCVFALFFFSLSRRKSWFLNISMKILLCSILCSLFFSPFSVKSYFLSVFHENLGVFNSLLFFLCFVRSHSVFCGFSLCVFALFFFPSSEAFPNPGGIQKKYIGNFLQTHCLFYF